VRRAAIGMAAVAAFAAGCATTHPGEDAIRVEGVPPPANPRFHCGPATLASVMAFHGSDVGEPAVADAIYSESARGTLLADMAWFAREHGFEARLFPGDLGDLRKAVEDGLPRVVLLDLGILNLRKPHFTAVTGFAGDGVLLLGSRSAGDYAPRKEFLRQWQRAGNMVLLISPR
jgi:predicted double-glycine peptidase